MPLFLSGIYFTNKLINTAKIQEKTHLLNSVDAIKDSFDKALEPITLVSHAIMADTAVYKFILVDYNEQKNYFQVHSDYLRPTLEKYVAGFSSIGTILVYVDNPTIGVSAGYISLNNVNRNSIWYSKLNTNKKDSIVIKYTETDLRTSMVLADTCSYFRYMTNQSVPNSNEIILRMDIQISKLEALVENLPLRGFINLSDSFGNSIVSWDSGNISPNDTSLTKIVKKIDFANGMTLEFNISADVPSISESFSLKNYIFVTFLSILATLVFILILSFSVTSRIHMLSTHIRKVEKGDYTPININMDAKDEIGILIKDFNLMTERINILINQVYKAELEHNELRLTQKQAELETLLSQINPHFLNNVLESIRMRSLIKDEFETADIILKLSRIFRRMLLWDRDLIPLEEELNFTKEYLDIQKYRFDDKLEFSINENFTPKKWYIPRITLQVLVENACIHGIEKLKSCGVINIVAEELDDILNLVVEDNGLGFNTTNLTYGIGLSNLKQRLELYYKSRGSMNIDSSETNGTKVTIKIPKGQFYG
ncbi:MAG: sensor histidine kinase [Spirochaetales bacterium]|nr:sensor histidine kinase [Spirochaetales bacterium]